MSKQSYTYASPPPGVEGGIWITVLQIVVTSRSNGLWQLHSLVFEGNYVSDRFHFSDTVLYKSSMKVTQHTASRST